MHNDVFGFGHSKAEHSDRNSSLPVQSTRLTWTNVVHKVTVMLPYVWPSGHETLQFVVLLCLAMLVAGRVLNVYIPLYSKYIGQCSVDVAEVS